LAIAKVGFDPNFQQQSTAQMEAVMLHSALFLLVAYAGVAWAARGAGESIAWKRALAGLFGALLFIGGMTIAIDIAIQNALR
jgi:hypothetical protein